MSHFKFLKCNLEYLEYDKNNTRSKSWKNLVANMLTKKSLHITSIFSVLVEYLKFPKWDRMGLLAHGVGP